MASARAAATFEPVGRSVAAARGFVRDTLEGWGFTDVVDDAVVLASELVTNAVVHAGTSAEVLCLRRAEDDDSVRIEVADRYPNRTLPLHPGEDERRGPELEREGGRGLILCAALSTRWGVEYSPSHKRVWFQLDLPTRTDGTRHVGPLTPDSQLPASESALHVAVVRLDRDGLVVSWNRDAEELLRLPADKALGHPFADLAAWPQTPGTGLALDDALRLSRWEGGYAVRCGDGRLLPVYATHLRVRDAEGEPSSVCLLVRAQDRALLQSPAIRATAETTGLPGGLPGAPSLGAAAAETPTAGPIGTFEAFIGSPVPDDLDGLLQRTVERARDLLDGDAAYLLLATDDETELEVRATCGLATGRRRFARVPVESAAGRYAPARLPAVHDDLDERPGEVPVLTGTGLRSVVSVPLKVEGRLTGSIAVAAQAPRRYATEDALRLQFAADRIALAVESARLTELERLRRGSLSFLVEASDLLAGTLEWDQTLALMAQMTIPNVATWCAVYTIDNPRTDPTLAYTLHEDEDRTDGLRALLRRLPAPEPVNRPGAIVWNAPRQAAAEALARATADPAHELALTPEELDTLRNTADTVGGETVVLPLVARNKVIGMLTLGKSTDDTFRHEILELAVDLSRRAALALDNAGLYGERNSISQALQRSLLPPEDPTIPGIEVEVVYQAAGEGNDVGGDFYDIFPIREGVYGFAIGDVCGTGPDAAAVTGLARHSLRLLAREGLSTAQVLLRLNAAILEEGERSRFLTLVYGEMTPRQDGGMDMRLVCAGHPQPLRLRPNGQVAKVAKPQPLLGVIEDLELTEETLLLEPGDVLLCVTDGITERREGDRMLGEDGLAEVLAGCTGLSAGAVAARVQRAVEGFAPEPASDDMAIIALRLPSASAKG